jgi:NAD-dependent DNA ligase
LDGLSFVCTGTFENITRDNLEIFLLTHGGRKVGSISNRVDYLIAGCRMEDGREVTMGSKYRAAEAKGVTILREKELEELVKSLSGNKEFAFGQ